MYRKKKIAGPYLEEHLSNRPRRYKLDTNGLTLEVATKGSRNHRPHPRLNTNTTLSPKVSTKGLLVWGGLIAVLSIPLSAIHHISNWWLLLVFGVVLPIALGVGNRIANSRKIQAHSAADHSSERELLEVLERHGEITPLTAATRISLTVTEADQMLSELAQKGHLEVRVDGGKISYSPWERARQDSRSS